MHSQKTSRKGWAMAAATVLAGIFLLTPSLTTAVELKISHQFAEADARNDLAVKFAHVHLPSGLRLRQSA